MTKSDTFIDPCCLRSDLTQNFPYIVEMLPCMRMIARFACVWSTKVIFTVTGMRRPAICYSRAAYMQSKVISVSKNWNARAAIVWIASNCYNCYLAKCHARHWNAWKFWTKQDKLGLCTCHLDIYLVLFNYCIPARAWLKLWVVTFFCFVFKYVFTSCKKGFACLLQLAQHVRLHDSLDALSWNWQPSRRHLYTWCCR